jgi:hypothetical protein
VSVRIQRYANVSVTTILQVGVAIGSSGQQSAVPIPPPAEPTLSPMIVMSTPVEKALDELRARFPIGIVIGFEELFDPRPDKEPQLDLGPTGSSLEQVLNRVRTIDPKYRVELLQSGLVHVYPAKETADPVGLLDIRIRQSSMPQDSCLAQAIGSIDGWSRGYAPELTEFLAKRKEAWYRKHGGQVPGEVGDILGNCFALAAPGPVRRNTTVRDALNLMAKRSLEVSRGEVTPNDPIYPPYKPLSWKFRFRSLVTGRARTTAPPS